MFPLDDGLSYLLSNHTCLAIITFDSDFKNDDSYYPQGFLKVSKYIVKLQHEPFEQLILTLACLLLPS